jgi:hypothetical protein
MAWMATQTKATLIKATPGIAVLLTVSYLLDDIAASTEPESHVFRRP